MEGKDWARFFEEVEPLIEKWTNCYSARALREEAKQVARIACWRKLPYYDASRGAALSTYLYLVVRGALINWYEQEKRWRNRHSFPSSEEEGLTWEEVISDPQAEYLEDALLWDSWMSYLSAQEALCLTHHIRDGWPLRKIAEELDLPYERVKKQKQRALVKLRSVTHGENNK